MVAGLASLTTSPSLYAKLSYDPLKDLAPVILMSAAPLVLVVHPSLPARTTKEVIAPEMRGRMEELGLDVIASTPEQFAQHLRTETDKWASP